MCCGVGIVPFTLSEDISSLLHPIKCKLKLFAVKFRIGLIDTGWISRTLLVPSGYSSNFKASHARPIQFKFSHECNEGRDWRSAENDWCFKRAYYWLSKEASIQIQTCSTSARLENGDGPPTMHSFLFHVFHSKTLQYLRNFGGIPYFPLSRIMC